MVLRWLQNLSRESLTSLALGALVFVPASAFAQEDGLFDAPAAEEAGEEAAQPQLGDFNDIFGGPAAPTRTPEEADAIRQQIAQFNAAARAKAQQGDIEGAIATYNEALAVENNFESNFEMGVLLREQGYPEDATRAFVQASAFANLVEDTNMVVRNYIELGLAYLDADQFNAAISMFSNAMGLPGQSRNPELMFNLGRAQAEFALNQQFATAQTRAEDLQKAIDSLDRALRIKPDFAEALFERGKAYVELGDLEQAIDDLKQSVALDPSNSEAVALLGVASLSRGIGESNARNGQTAQITADLEMAIAQLSRYLELVPEPEPFAEEDEDLDPRYQRENVLLQRSAAFISLAGEVPDRAKELYTKAVADNDAIIEKDPDNSDAYYQKGVALRMLGDMPGALAALTESIELSPFTSSEALLRRGILHFREGDYQLAQADFTRSIQFTRGGINPRASFWRGLAKAKQEMTEEAISDYSLAIRYQPNFSMAYYNRALLYMEMGRFDQAVNDLNQVILRDSGNQQARQLRDQASELAASES